VARYQDPDDEVVGYEGHIGQGGYFSARAVTRGEAARRPGCGARLVAAVVLALVATCALADEGPRAFGLPAWATPGFVLSLGFNAGVGVVLAGVAGLVLGAPRAGCAAVLVLLAAANCWWGVRAGAAVASWPLVGAAVAALAGLGVARGITHGVARGVRRFVRGPTNGPPPPRRS
jgi:hypothetical protein